MEACIITLLLKKSSYLYTRPMLETTSYSWFSNFSPCNWDIPFVKQHWVSVLEYPFSNPTRSSHVLEKLKLKCWLLSASLHPQLENVQLHICGLSAASVHWNCLISYTNITYFYYDVKRMKKAYAWIVTYIFFVFLAAAITFVVTW